MKGDATKYQNAIDTQGGLAQQNLQATRARQLALQQQMQNSYNTSLGKSGADYDEMMNNYRNFMAQNQAINPADRFSQERAGYGAFASGANNIALDPTMAANVGEAIGHYKDFANTGGFSTADIQNLRARGIAPTRAIYGQAQNNLDRARALSGGTMTNYGAASAKMARELSHAIGDANVDVNASIAEKVQQGKLAGTAGLAGTSLAQQGAQLQVDQINNQMKLAGLGGLTDTDKAILAGELAKGSQGLEAMAGQRSLYGTRPGLTDMFGNQVLAAGGQDLEGQQLENQLRLGLINAQGGRSNIPGNYQQGLGNVGSTLGMLGQVGGVLGGLGKFGGAAKGGGSWWKSLLGLAGSGHGSSNSYIDANGFDPYGNFIGYGNNPYLPGNTDPNHE